MRTHAATTCPATPQRTAEKRLVAPTPMIAEPIAWVVETGMPSRAATVITVAAPVSAANPCTGSRWVIRMPDVRTTRQPPTIVPRPITSPAERTIQGAIVSSPTLPAVPASLRAMVRAMIPIVFWASFVP